MRIVKHPAVFARLRYWRPDHLKVGILVMETPRAEGLNVLALIGIGGCGRVYHVDAHGGGMMALKIFDDAAIHRELLERMTLRLEQGGWPEGVMPLISEGDDMEPGIRLSPLLADVGEEGSIRPRSLQHRLNEHPGNESWDLVRSIAKALAGMHRRRVAHGNLKPGNVMFDEGGGVLLTDWTLGNMPGVRRFDFTDALLYQPPEQLRNPSGYLEEHGYAWDVFAFGVLAYRVLTGVFPRCEETFSKVAPSVGTTRRVGIHADLPRIAKNIENQAMSPWPYEARCSLEQGLRDWIERCLAIDPALRPASMIEVVDGIAAVEKASTVEMEIEALLDQRRRSARKAWRSMYAMGGTAAAALILAGLWQWSAARLKHEKSEREREVAAINKESDAAIRDGAMAETRAVNAERALADERKIGAARLEASRVIGDHLFSWAMEKGHRQLPPLDGRELRLKRLERYFEDFLIRTADIDSLRDERARVRLQLAEISLAAGDAVGATSRLTEALAASSDLPLDADLKMRMATNSLLLALLRQSQSDPVTGEAFADARKKFSDVPSAEVDSVRLEQLLAILDFHEAKLLASNGEDAKALEQLTRATQTLNRISDQLPDAVILRSELAACYLASATILEGMGSLGDAREVRGLAAVELRAILQKKPSDPVLRLELAGCYGTMAETAVLSGDVAGAEPLLREAMALLDQLLIEQPDNVEAIARKAAQLGLRAGILRDLGKAEEAMKDFDDGIRMLEGVRASSSADGMISYRLALLWWQKGRMLGIAGERNQEIVFIRKAGDLLEKLEASRPAAGLRPEQLQRTSAYLLGDLGHALQLTGKNDEARGVFGDALAKWELLVASRPRSEEYNEGRQWCRQRLESLK